jgi:hypothetical protein
MRFENLYKLVTRDDSFHLHKTLGILAMSHFVFRAFLLITTGTMGFETNFALSSVAIAIHLCLSTSSLIFKLSKKRIKTAPMIYPEFRLHSIIFASRSLALMAMQTCCMHFFGVLPPFMLRWLVVMLAMVCADYTTRCLGDARGNGTTIRDMPFPEFVPSQFVAMVNTFYSQSQILATSYLLFGTSSSQLTEYAFLILFPIQMAAFLMTMVKKGIISSVDWHAVYSLSLALPYVYLVLRTKPMENIPALPIGLMYCFLRINTRLSKYLLWNLLGFAWFLIITATPKPWTLPFLPSQPADYAGSIESLLSSAPAILPAHR